MSKTVENLTKTYLFTPDFSFLWASSALAAKNHHAEDVAKQAPDVLYTRCAKIAHVANRGERFKYEGKIARLSKIFTACALADKGVCSAAPRCRPYIPIYH
jgi:hypothetical protein